MDWDDVRVFLAVERAGSVTSAAQTLDVDASTVGRRLARFEGALGASLFERSRAGTTLTAAGERVLPEAERLEEAALTVLAVGGQERGEVEGTVRLATAEGLVVGFLQPHLARLRLLHPGLCLELVTSTRSANLMKREADVALRPASKRPAQQKVAARKLAELDFGLYASAAYLARRGPMTEHAAGHDVVGFDAQFGTTPQMAWAERNLRGGQVTFTANSMLGRTEACVAGWGLAALPAFLARRHPELVRVEAEIPRTFLWLVVHPELRRSARVRALLDFLAEAVELHADQFRA